MDTRSASRSPQPLADEECGASSTILSASRGRHASSSQDTGGHIKLDEPPRRPHLYSQVSLRGASSKSVSEALRLARSREEQETLLGVEEEADDDGCYPPRVDDAPRQPNAWAHLPVYTNIVRIRRLVIASIGTVVLRGCELRRIHLSPLSRALNDH